MRKFVAPVVLGVTFALALASAGGTAAGAPPLQGGGKGGNVGPTGGGSPLSGWNSNRPGPGLPMVQVVRETVTRNFRTSTTTTSTQVLGVFYTYDQARTSMVYKNSLAQDRSSGVTGAGMTTVTTKIK